MSISNDDIKIKSQDNKNKQNRKIRVMLVDDSVVIRGFISRIIDANDDMEVVGSMQNGQFALNSIKRIDPDVILLDIEMPVMDGITALPKLLEADPEVKIIMCSTLTQRNADITLKALSLGAVDCIAKPTSSVELRNKQDFNDSLVRMIREIGTTKNIPARVESKIAVRNVTNKIDLKDKKSFTLRKTQNGLYHKPDIIAVGSSTGGPQALFGLIKNFKNVKVPIVITQHMPPTFTTILAQHIEQQTGVKAFEGEDGMKIEAGCAYIAPGGIHMTLERKAGGVYIKLDDGPPENFCKPSVDVMMRSVVSVYGKKVVGVMLTGMGNDGLSGFKELVDAGGYCIAQDEETSVVWGMPGAVAMAGICSEVLPLEKLGPWVNNVLK